MESAPEIFISYSWKEPSDAVADELEAVLAARHLQVVRDKSNLGYKGLIREFMDRVGKARYVILILSDDYLRSENCMYELLQIAAGELSTRVFPLILPGARIEKAADRIKYVHYWQKEVKELESVIKKGALTHIQGIMNDLNFYSEISAKMDSITGILKNINALSLQLMQVNNYAPLVERLVRQIEQDFGKDELTARDEAADVKRYIGQQLGHPATEKIEKVFALLEKNHDRLSLVAEFLAPVVPEVAKAQDIAEFYATWRQFMEQDGVVSANFYVSKIKTNKFFALHKQEIIKRYQVDFAEADDTYEKIKWLLKFYRDTGRLIFLPGWLLRGDELPDVNEPVIFFKSEFTLADRLADRFSEITEDYTPESPIPFETAYFILHHPNPMAYPIMRFSGRMTGVGVTMEFSRTQTEFSSGTTDLARGILSKEPVVFSGFGTLERAEDNTINIQPIILRKGAKRS
jgi:hypothetical protein